MSSRRVQILVALVLTALWGAGIYAGHANGHLRFLDRLEATLTDWRTQVRGVRVPPDLVTIVAIDDTVVKRGGSYPLPRADLARVVDTIVQFKPKVVAIDLLLVDRSAAIGDATLANTLATGPIVLAAAAIFPSPARPWRPAAKAPSPRCRRPSASCCPCRRSPIMPRSASSMLRPDNRARRSRCRCC